MRFPMAVKTNMRATRPLQSALGPSEARRAFCTALERYAEADGTNGQAWLLEAIIRTSRGVAEDHGAVSRDERSTLHQILDRYRGFYPGHLDQDVITYSDAHNALRVLFF